MPCLKNDSPESSGVRVVLKFQLRRQQSKAVMPVTEPKAQRTSSVRLSRLMALALRFEDLLRRGEVGDYSELSRRYLVDRGRISRIMHLTLLAPDLQRQVLNMQESEWELCLKHLLPVCRKPLWESQRIAFEKLWSEKQRNLIYPTNPAQSSSRKVS